MFRRITQLALLTITLTASGCQTGGSWFSMSSDSPMPWFGFDIALPRRTSAVEHLEVPEDHSRSFNTSLSRRGDVKTASRRQPVQARSKELNLPSIPMFFENNPAEELSFTGPQSSFSK